MSSASYPIHAVFAAHEMTPNITPVLDKRLAARKVLIFFTDNMRASAERLSAVYQNHQVEVVLCEVRSAFDAGLLIEDLKRYCADIDLSELAFNISCGTKINAVATVMAFSGTSAGIYYVLPSDDLAWLQPQGQPEFNLADNIKLDEFMKLHQATRFIVNHFNTNETVFANGVIDLLVKKMLQQGRYDDFQLFSRLYHQKQAFQLISTTKGYRWQNESGSNADVFADFLNHLAKKGLVHLKQSNGTLSMTQPAPNWQRLIAGGGWLEYWVYRTIRNLQQQIPQIQDVAYGAKVHFDESSDEVDVIFLVNNQLYVIECKSGGTANINHHLHRINSLRKSLGGVISHAAYITTEKLAQQSRYKNKAERLQDVLLLERKDLLHLKTKLKAWITSKIH